jgi:rhodanese-related sulfurtransferase
MKLYVNRLLGTLFVSMLLLGAGQVLASSGETPDQIPGTTKVTAEDLISLVEKHDNLVIIDARKAEDYQGGFVEGAISLPDTVTNPESLAKVVPGKDTPVLFYCNGKKCGRSVKSCKTAVADGYKTVYWYRGGWDDWVAKGLPVAH